MKVTGGKAARSVRKTWVPALLLQGRWRPSARDVGNLASARGRVGPGAPGRVYLMFSKGRAEGTE